MEKEWRIEMFGGLQLKRGDEFVEVSTRGATRELLICLALRLGQSYSRDDLAKCVWQKQTDPVKRRDNLRHALPQLHMLFEIEGAASGSVLREQEGKVSLNPERVKTDVADFLATYNEALREGSATEQVERLTKAVDLYPGELLPGYDQTWIVTERNQLAKQYRGALRRLKTTLLEMDRLPEATEVARQLADSFSLEDETVRPQREKAMEDYLALYADLSRRLQAASPSKSLPADDGPAPSGSTAESVIRGAPLTIREADPGRTSLTGKFRRAPAFLVGVLILLGLAAVLAGPFLRALRLHQSIQRVGDRDRLYQVGRDHWNERTEEGLRQSRADFVRLTNADPDYAPGYAGLADADSLLGYYGWVPPQQAFDRALGEAREATSRVRTDPEKAEAYTSLAWAELLRWQWGPSESDFHTAFGFDYYHPSARQWHSLLLMVQGQGDKSIGEINQAVGRDPTPVIRKSAAQRYYYKGDYDNALSECADILTNHPRDRLTFLWQGLAYEQEHKTKEALAAFHMADDLSGQRDMSMRAGLAHAFAHFGDTRASRQILTEMLRLRHAGSFYVSPVDLAIVYTGLYDQDRNTPKSKQAVEEKEQALAWLEQGHQEHAGQLFLIGVEPRFASLREEPRFSHLIHKMGLPPTPGGALPSPN